MKHRHQLLEEAWFKWWRVNASELKTGCGFILARKTRLVDNDENSTYKKGTVLTYMGGNANDPKNPEMVVLVDGRVHKIAPSRLFYNLESVTL